LQNLRLSELISAQMICEAPSDKIYSFQGVITLKKPHDSPSSNLEGVKNKSSEMRSKVVFDYSSFLLRGSSLRNTEYVVGIAVYVGSETRIMKNSVQSRIKRSKLDRMMSYQLLFTFIIECILCLFASSYELWWNKNWDIQTNQYLGFYPLGTS